MCVFIWLNWHRNIVLIEWDLTSLFLPPKVKRYLFIVKKKREQKQSRDAQSIWECVCVCLCMHVHIKTKCKQWYRKERWYQRCIQWMCFTVCVIFVEKFYHRFRTFYPSCTQQQVANKIFFICVINCLKLVYDDDNYYYLLCIFMCGGVHIKRVGLNRKEEEEEENKKIQRKRKILNTKRVLIVWMQMYIFCNIMETILFITCVKMAHLQGVCFSQLKAERMHSECSEQNVMCHESPISFIWCEMQTIRMSFE